MKNGMVNLIKPPQMTSHDVVNWLRRQLNMKKIGHTGTLDPMATGVMNLMVGQATRLIPYLQHEFKSYRAVMVLGKTSDTLDIWGEVHEVEGPATPTRQQVEAVFQRFTGEIQQVPPMFSAVKVEGVKLYHHARRGETVERQPRRVVIESLRLIHIVESSIIFDVVCSRGTYVRTLIDDIGKAMGTRAIMTDLVRTCNEGVSIDEAHTLEEAARRLGAGDESLFVRPLEILRDVSSRRELNEGEMEDLRNGRRFRLDISDPLVLLTHRQRLVGLASCESGRSRILRRFISEVK